MRILSFEESKKIDLRFIYANGTAIAIVNPDIFKKFDLVKKQEIEKK